MAYATDFRIRPSVRSEVGHPSYRLILLDAGGGTLSYQDFATRREAMAMGRRAVRERHTGKGYTIMGYRIPEGEGEFRTRGSIRGRWEEVHRAEEAGHPIRHPRAFVFGAATGRARTRRGPYADPGYQADGKPRYELSSIARIRAAWAYINRPGNARRYTATQLRSIHRRIQAAGRKHGIAFGHARSR